MQSQSKYIQKSPQLAIFEDFVTSRLRSSGHKTKQSFEPKRGLNLHARDGIDSGLDDRVDQRYLNNLQSLVSGAGEHFKENLENAIKMYRKCYGFDASIRPSKYLN